MNVEGHWILLHKIGLRSVLWPI